MNIIESKSSTNVNPTIALKKNYSSGSYLEAATKLMEMIEAKSKIENMFLSFSFSFFFFFLALHLWHMEVSRLGVASELQFPAYTTATATPDR